MNKTLNLFGGFISVELYLDSNLLNGTVSECIGTNLRELKKMHLFGNRFSGTIPSTLGQLQKIGENNGTID